MLTEKKTTKIYKQKCNEHTVVSHLALWWV